VNDDLVNKASEQRLFVLTCKGTGVPDVGQFSAQLRKRLFDRDFYLLGETPDVKPLPARLCAIGKFFACVYTIAVLFGVCFMPKTFAGSWTASFSSSRFASAESSFN
jgi:hypothetical protein